MKGKKVPTDEEQINRMVVHFIMSHPDLENGSLNGRIWIQSGQDP